ncbi:MAG: LytTR family DNA-binding domain-containing protein [Tannerella sp.]|jgi:two-component system LytT family response regulator|nr:LytTR family DNA-binding domain-containing protein [Tannerella sp.]
MDKIKTVIVEDELLAREVLRNYIAKYCPQLEITGEGHNAGEAIKIIRELQPQLVFLDVEMPYGNAFDVLEGCKELYFETIFATAFSEYSLRALNQSAAYYLLKPVSIEELIQAVNKVQQHIINHEIFNRNRILIENIREPKPERQRVILPTLEGFEVERMEDILRLQGNGNFTDVYFRNRAKPKRMVCRLLKYFDEILPYPFLRVHKSHIINVNAVKSYLKSSGGIIVLEDETEIEISPSYKSEFFRLFKN